MSTFEFKFSNLKSSAGGGAQSAGGLDRVDFSPTEDNGERTEEHSVPSIGTFQPRVCASGILLCQFAWGCDVEAGYGRELKGLVLMLHADLLECLAPYAAGSIAGVEGC